MKNDEVISKYEKAEGCGLRWISDSKLKQRDSLSKNWELCESQNPNNFLDHGIWNDIAGSINETTKKWVP